MIHKDVQEAVSRWLLNGDGNLDLVSDLDLINYLGSELYHQYEPTIGLETFDVRLRDWLFKHPLEDRRKTLFALVPYLFFFGHDEFASLRRAALGGVVPRFLIDTGGLSLADPNLDVAIASSLSTTLFMGLSKSGGIYDFCKTNQISQGLQFHADVLFRTGITPQQKQLISGYTSLVLVEDFIGSGDQSAGPISFVCAEFPAHNVLCVPLLCCPAGLQRGQDLEKIHQNLAFAPVSTLPRSAFVHSSSEPGEIAIADAVRSLVAGMPAEVAGYAGIASSFGYADTGALSILYSNCPDNVLDLVHAAVPNAWSALFPRV